MLSQQSTKNRVPQSDNSGNEILSRDPAFIQIPYLVLRDAEISHAAKLVYGRLKLYAGRNGQCNPKHETLAREVCLSVRQVKNVLIELRRAGWVDWHRTRTSCQYKVHPDRQERASQIGKKLPITSAKTCLSRSAENCLQKRGTEDHHLKEAVEKKSGCCSESSAKPESQNPISKNADDDEKPKTQIPNPSPGGVRADPWGELRKLAPSMTLKEERKLREKLELKGITPTALLEHARQNLPDNWKLGPIAALFSMVKDWSQPAADFHAALEAFTPKMEAVPTMTKAEIELKEAMVAAPRKTQEQIQEQIAEMQKQLGACAKRPPATLAHDAGAGKRAESKLSEMGL